MTLEEMAAELRKSGWTVDPPWSPETCKHINKSGHGSLLPDGSTSWAWRCGACGKEETGIAPAVAGKQQWTIGL